MDGKLRGTFIDDERIVDPRGLAVDPKENVLFLNSGADRVIAISPQGRIIRDTGRIEGLPGGAFGTDGRYCVGLRTAQAIIALSTSLDANSENVLPPRIVPFPRGLAFGHDGRLFLASGIGPNGENDNSILAFNPGTPTQPTRLVMDPELSPLDLAIAPNGNIVVSSKRPFGVEAAITSVREYDATDGHLIRVSLQTATLSSASRAAFIVESRTWSRNVPGRVHYHRTGVGISGMRASTAKAFSSTTVYLLFPPFTKITRFQ